jgi:hypothetical protein
MFANTDDTLLAKWIFAFSARGEIAFRDGRGGNRVAITFLLINHYQLSI